jgi:HSP20 family protein
MANLKVWSPWGVVPRDFFDWDNDELATWSGDVQLDMYEDKENVVVKAKIAGFPKDQIDLSIENGRLTIKGSVKQEREEEEKDKKYYRKEITTKSFSRTVELPVAVKPEEAKASFKEGMLEISIPKSEEAKPKKISIDVKE